MTAQTTILRNAESRANFIALLLDAPLPLEIKIKPFEEGDQAHQREWYWWMLTIIAEQIIVDGRRHSKEVWHEYYKQKFLHIVDEITICNKTVFIYQSTEKLSIKERREYRYQVESDAVQELGVMFPEYRREAG